MHFYDIFLIPINEQDTAICAALSFVPRIGDLISTTPTGGNRHFEVVQVYAHEPRASDKQGRIEVLVRDVTIPEIFTKPES